VGVCEREGRNNEGRGGGGGGGGVEGTKEIPLTMLTR